MNIVPQLVPLFTRLCAGRVFAFVVVIFLVISVGSQSTKQQVCIWVMTSWNQNGRWQWAMAGGQSTALWGKPRVPVCDVISGVRSVCPPVAGVSRLLVMSQEKKRSETGPGEWLAFIAWNETPEFPRPLSLHPATQVHGRQFSSVFSNARIKAIAPSFCFRFTQSCPASGQFSVCSQL